MSDRHLAQRHYLGVSLQGVLLGSFTNIRLGWKGLQGTIKLAYNKLS
jgi:hypothetical protein